MAAIDEAAHTPMMRQYLDAKAQHPGALLFFRMGDFFELFFEDAVKASELLQLTLTSRSKSADPIPMAGVPYHAAQRYISRLIQAGQTVAICDQMEPPDGRNLVRREVVRVVSPGMVVDEDLLEAGTNNFLLSLSPPGGERSSWAAAALDASTGELLLYPASSMEDLADALAALAPREVLLPESLSELPSQLANGDPPVLSRLPDSAFSPRGGIAMLKAHFGVSTLEGFGVEEEEFQSVGAAAAALTFLKVTQKSDARHVDRLRVVRRAERLGIDETTRVNLELVRSLRNRGAEGSLVKVLDSTKTPMGARALRQWILNPLRDLQRIDERLDAVEELVRSPTVRNATIAALKPIGDLERLNARLILAVGGPRDLQAIGGSLRAIADLKRALEGTASSLLKEQVAAAADPKLALFAQVLERALVPVPPVGIADGGFIRAGYSEELDEVTAASTSGKSFLLSLEVEERERTGIASLKVRYNKVFGYFIEVTKANLHLVPKEWTRKQTTVGGERYVTAQLKEYEERVLTAEERRIEIERALFSSLRDSAMAHSRSIRAVASAIATIDALVSLATVAVVQRYVRPTFDGSGTIDLAGARHPVVELAIAPEVFVPNDIQLNRTGALLTVITGPNMSGKSTVMRETALAVIMAQAGSFVAASRAHIGLCDQVFARVGASDNLARGQSTFMVEMTETAAILHRATATSLVILDEIGRGTSTFDGLSLAWAIAEHLVLSIGARCLFATHYHELTQLAQEQPLVANACIAVAETQGTIRFLRTLEAGAANKSYGIEVARLAGVPAEVLARARTLLATLESADGADHPHRHALHAATVEAGSDGTRSNGEEGAASAVATPAAAVLEELGALDLDRTTPLDALAAIARWQAQVKKGA